MPYVFPCWWGGTGTSETPPQIREKLPELRKAVGNLKAEVKKGGPRFAIKSAKELMEKLRPALDELGMVDFPIALTGGNIPLVPVVDGDGDVVGGEGTMAFLMVTVRIGAPDGSYIDIVGAGHGADTQDKAGGKASTYAWKDAHIKGLDLPDDEMVDTDDEEKPIKGGIRQAAPAKSKTEVAAPKLTLDQAKAEIAAATSKAELSAAVKRAQASLSPEEQTQLADGYKAKKAELEK